MSILKSFFFQCEKTVALILLMGKNVQKTVISLQRCEIKNGILIRDTLIVSRHTDHSQSVANVQ